MKKAIIFLCLITFFNANAQNRIDQKTKQKAIQEFIKTIQEEYITEENIPVITDYLEKQLKNKVYDSINDPRDFARAVMMDARKISNDKHMGFGYHPENVNANDTVSHDA